MTDQQPCTRCDAPGPRPYDPAGCPECGGDTRRSWFRGPGSGCSDCRRRFWPSPTQARKRLVPIHDSPGGVCDGSLTPTVDF